VFVSHLTEEGPVAAVLREALDHDYLGLPRFFISSDSESLGAGDHWFDALKAHLRECSLVISLCSPVSVDRPWLNFEMGFAFALEKTIIPMCHGGLRPDELPMPWSVPNSFTLTEADGLRALYARISKSLSSRTPDRDFEQLARDLAAAYPSEITEDDEPGPSDRNRAIQRRLEEGLAKSDFEWRTLERLAAEAAVSADAAADVLRASEAVRFSRSKKGTIIVGLKARVGP
jgi:hypothetical protein